MFCCVAVVASVVVAATAVVVAATVEVVVVGGVVELFDWCCWWVALLHVIIYPHYAGHRWQCVSVQLSGRGEGREAAARSREACRDRAVVYAAGLPINTGVPVVGLSQMCGSCGQHPPAKTTMINNYCYYYYY